MPILEYLIPCQLTSVDQRTNAVSLFSIIDNVSVIRLPGQKESVLTDVPIEVVTTWRQVDSTEIGGNYTQSIFFVTPSGEEEEISTISFTLRHYRYRVHTQIPPVSVLNTGTYKIIVKLFGEASEVDSVYEYPIPVELTEAPIVIELDDEQLEKLNKPIRGEGGFQSLLRRIQSQIVGKTLVLSEADGERLMRYAKQYSSGGFQQRLGPIVEQVSKFF